MTHTRSIADLLGEPLTDTEKAVALIEARAEAHGDNDGHTMNGRAFALRFAGKLIFVPELNDWFHYDGVVWARIDVGVIMQGWAAEREATALNQHLAEETDKTKYALNHARWLLHSLDHQQKTLRAASQLPSMRKAHAAFDQGPHLLAVANGVVDLRRARLVPAHPSQYLMRRAPVHFDADAVCPDFLAYLLQVQPDAEMRKMIQRAIGYTLTGDVSEEKFFFAHGDGSNGKSILLGILEALMGSFAVNIPSAHLTAAKFSKDPEQVHARLIGARLALSNETREGTVWNEVLLKELSAYDRASARELYKGAVDYQPTHTLWIRGNHVPGSFDSSDGLARRYTPIAFGVTIPEHARDKGLLDRIKANELPGVLNWALVGARCWYMDRDLGLDGLRIPVSVKHERAEYKAESDWFGQWLAERTVADLDAATATSTLFSSYVNFCREGNTQAPSLIVFGRTMTKRGYSRLTANARKPARYRGLRLLQERTESFGE